MEVGKLVRVWDIPKLIKNDMSFQKIIINEMFYLEIKLLKKIIDWAEDIKTIIV